MRDKYILKVLSGNSLDLGQLKLLDVNNEDTPFRINHEYFDGYLKVRLKDYDGLPVNETLETIHPNSSYFDDNDTLFSIEFTGRFKNGPGSSPDLVNKKESDGKEGKGWPANDVYFGNQFDQPLRLPPGISVATKFAEWFDPGLKINLYDPKPSAYSPMIVAFNNLTVKKLPIDLEIPQPSPAINGPPIKENIEILAKQFSLSEQSSNERRKYYANPKHLDQLLLEEDLLIQGDFFNPYLDFNSRGVKLPLFTVNVMRFWDGQPLVYLCRSLKHSEVIFFTIAFILEEIDGAFQHKKETAILKEDVQILEDKVEDLSISDQNKHQSISTEGGVSNSTDPLDID